MSLSCKDKHKFTGIFRSNISTPHNDEATLTPTFKALTGGGPFCSLSLCRVKRAVLMGRLGLTPCVLRGEIAHGNPCGPHYGFTEALCFGKSNQLTRASQWALGLASNKRRSPGGLCLRQKAFIRGLALRCQPKKGFIFPSQRRGGLGSILGSGQLKAAATLFPKAFEARCPMSIANAQRVLGVSGKKNAPRYEQKQCTRRQLTERKPLEMPFPAR